MFAIGGHVMQSLGVTEKDAAVIEQILGASHWFRIQDLPMPNARCLISLRSFTDWQVIHPAGYVPR